MTRALLLVALLAPAFGCATAQAKQPVAGPTLEVPPVPGRLIDPVLPPEKPPTPDPVPELPPPPVPPRPRPTPPPAREAPKPEAKPIEPMPVEPPPPNVSPLRTPNTPDGAEALRQVREIIDRATRTLNSIDYRFLSNERKAQYDNAKLLLTQAEDAVKTTNFDIARNLADKADQIARQLQPR